MQMYDDGTMKDYTEMARIGITSNDYEIYINVDDTGIKPHFHYRKVNDWHAFHTCIMIEKPDYFHHGNKQDILNSKQKKELIEFLNSKSKNKRYESNWEYLVSMWNDNNSDVIIDESMEIPDYKQLPNKR